MLPIVRNRLYIERWAWMFVNMIKTPITLQTRLVNLLRSEPLRSFNLRHWRTQRPNVIRSHLLQNCKIPRLFSLVLPECSKSPLSLRKDRETVRHIIQSFLEHAALGSRGMGTEKGATNPTQCAEQTLRTWCKGLGVLSSSSSLLVAECSVCEDVIVGALASLPPRSIRS